MNMFLKTILMVSTFYVFVASASAKTLKFVCNPHTQIDTEYGDHEGGKDTDRWQIKQSVITYDTDTSILAFDIENMHYVSDFFDANSCKTDDIAVTCSQQKKTDLYGRYGGVTSNYLRISLNRTDLILSYSWQEKYKNSEDVDKIRIKGSTRCEKLKRAF